MKIGIIQSFFGKWCYRTNANTVLNSITPSAHYLALKRFNIPVCLPHISSWKRNLLRLFEWHEILQCRGGTACASPRGVPLLSEAEGFVPLELTEKQSRETHQENVANVPFLSMLRFMTRCTSPVCTGCNNQVTELIVKDFSLRMQDCPVCPALISTDTTSLTGRASWNYRWHWINTDQHPMFYHISCKISLTTAQPVQNLLKQAVFDVN